MNLDELDRMTADTGCRVHSDCLTCHLPDCVYVTGKKYYSKTVERYKLIRQMATSNSCADIARQLGVGLQTIRRALKEDTIDGKKC